MRKLSKLQRITLKAINDLCETDSEHFFNAYQIVREVHSMNDCLLYHVSDIQKAIDWLAKNKILNHVIDFPYVRYRINTQMSSINE